MATSQVTGVNFTLDGNTVDFFGTKGTKFGDGYWGISAVNEDVWVEIEPSSIMDRVRCCIEDDVEAGNDDKVAQLQLGARQAVGFFLEGMLTRKHLKKSVEGLEFIDIPDVEVEGYTLTVRITANPEYEVATADDKGNVL